jgi:transposase
VNGPLSQRLFAAMRAAGPAAELLETRHVRGAFKAMPVKTDRKDARGIAQPMRLGWFRPVHCKSLPAQETRAPLAARKLPQARRPDVEMSLRGVLRGFGLKVGPTTPRSFAARIRELAEGHPTLTAVADALLAAREAPGGQPRGLERRLRDQAREDERARLPMTTPGVGVIVALTFAAAVDDPGRFRSSKAVGAHFGLTPKRHQSGETDLTGRIGKIGDAGVRTALYGPRHRLGREHHPDPPGGGIGPEELGGAPGSARGPARGEGGIGEEARRGHAQDAGGRNALRRRARRRGGLRQGRRDRGFGRPEASTARSEVPSPGRWIGPGRTRPSGAARTTALRQIGRPAPPPTPSGGGPAPTPDRSESSATGSALKGVDFRRPVTEAPSTAAARLGRCAAPHARLRSPPPRTRPSGCRGHAGRRRTRTSWSPGASASGCGGAERHSL